jgi:hypothetical protein
MKMCVICENKVSNFEEILQIRCNEIKEITTLPDNIKKLGLINCNNLVNIDENLKLELVFIDDCYNIKTLPLTLTKLIIKHGNISYDLLFKLNLLEYLEYYRCQLTSLPKLENLKMLVIEKSYIQNLNSSDFPKLEFLQCKESRIEEIKGLNLKTISCYSCKRLKTISDTPNLQSIDCRDCENLEPIENENKIKILWKGSLFSRPRIIKE